MVPGVFRQIRVALVLRLFKIRQHVLETPTGIAEALPVVVVPPVAPHVQHRVQYARAADHFAPGPTAPFALHRLARRVVRLRLVLPVVLAAVQVQRYGRHVRDFGLVAAGLQQQHVPLRVGGQTVGDHRARRTAANHNEIVFRPEILLVDQPALRIVQLVVVVRQSGQERGQKQQFPAAQLGGQFHGANEHRACVHHF